MSFIGTNLLLNSTCTIARSTTSKNAKNQKVKAAPATVEANVKCRLITKKKTRVIDGTVHTFAESVLYLPFGQDVKAEDVITFGAETYSVQFAITNPGNSSHHVEAYLTDMEV